MNINRRIIQIKSKYTNHMNVQRMQSRTWVGNILIRRPIRHSKQEVDTKQNVRNIARSHTFQTKHKSQNVSKTSKTSQAVIVIPTLQYGVPVQVVSTPK